MTEPLPAVRRVRLRVLPWRPRWRSRDLDLPDLSGVADLFDDVLGALLLVLAVLFLLPFVLAVLFGVALLSIELLALLALLPLLLVGRLCHLRPWVLVVSHVDGTQRTVDVVGLSAARRRRRELLAAGAVAAADAGEVLVRGHGA